jgi:hypothetical protein
VPRLRSFALGADADQSVWPALGLVTDDLEQEPARLVPDIAKSIRYRGTEEGVRRNERSKWEERGDQAALVPGFRR